MWVMFVSQLEAGGIVWVMLVSQLEVGGIVRVALVRWFEAVGTVRRIRMQATGVGRIWLVQQSSIQIAIEKWLKCKWRVAE